MRRPATSLAVDLLPKEGIALHEHRRHQLAIAGGGAFTVLAEGAGFVVPAGRAIFIPAGVPHAIRNRGRTRLCGVYLAPGLSDAMPGVCTVLEAPPLLTELVRAAMSLPEVYGPGDAAGRLVAVIVDQVLAAVPAAFGRLPMPAGQKLRRIAETLLDHPADGRRLEDWAKETGASARTLLRLFRKETGLGFEEWRTALRVSAAMAWLAEGRRVTDVALDLGYESPSAFIAMFKRQTGVSPRRFARG